MIWTAKSILDSFYIRVIYNFIIINMFIILYDAKENVSVRLCGAFACELHYIKYYILI